MTEKVPTIKEVVDDLRRSLGMAESQIALLHAMGVELKILARRLPENEFEPLPPIIEFEVRATKTTTF